MIRVDRSRAAEPRSLRREGQAHLASTIEPLVAKDQLRSRDFSQAIYGAHDVRQRLWKMQHRKCCFCERLHEDKHSTVEHFRPKTRASDGTGNDRPGYWWLAYEFRNLYFCCKNCNTPKGTFFPLASGSQPLSARELPWQTTEAALLLDPGVDDPELHIEWRWMGRRRGYVPVGRTDRGKQTIRATKLDQRDTLSQLRARHYRREIRPVIKEYRRAKHDDDAVAVTAARARAEHLSQPDAEFSGMSRSVLKRAGVLAGVL